MAPIAISSTLFLFTIWGIGILLNFFSENLGKTAGAVEFIKSKLCRLFQLSPGGGVKMDAQGRLIVMVVAQPDLETVPLRQLAPSAPE
jgi:hypothetical protein